MVHLDFSDVNLLCSAPSLRFLARASSTLAWRRPLSLRSQLHSEHSAKQQRGRRTIIGSCNALVPPSVVGPCRTREGAVRSPFLDPSCCYNSRPLARRVRRCCYNSYISAASAPDLRTTLTITLIVLEWYWEVVYESGMDLILILLTVQV